LIWPALALILALGVRLTAGARAVDDAFITFRYASNLVNGDGLVYNPGEIVLGTSTPLYAVILAATAWLSGIRSFPDLALWVNAVSDGLAVILVFQIGRRLSLPTGPALLGCMLVAFSPLVVRYSIGGMESSLVTAACLLSTYLYLRGRRVSPFLLAGIAVWLRPDAMAFGAALLGAEFWRIRRVPWRPLALFAACILFEIVMLTLGYGQALPQSVLAKAHHVYRIAPSTNFFQHIYLFSGLSLTGARGFGARGLVVNPAPGLNALALASFILMVPIWGAGALRMVRREPRALVIPLLPALFAVAYSALGLRSGLMAEWYLVPLVPFWLIPLITGLAAIADGARSAWTRRLVWVLPLTLLVLEISGLNLGRDPSLPASLPLNVWTEREDLYRQAAEFIEGQATEKSVVAASEIGAFGYACNCLVLDTVGLVSPSATPYYPLPEGITASNYAVPTDLILDLRPDFLVSLEVFLRQTVLADRRFLEEYELVWQVPTDAFGSQGLRVYALRNHR